MSRSNDFESSPISVFAGNANPILAHEITRHLHVPMGRANVGRFSDGEVNAELMENVRGREIVRKLPPAADAFLVRGLNDSPLLERLSAA